MSILSADEIQKQIDLGHIEIDPFEPKRLNETSVDLTLGDEVRVYTNWTRIPEIIGVSEPSYDGRLIRPIKSDGHEAADSKNPLSSRSWKISDRGWVLHPGVGYLMHTRERVKTTKFNPVLDGKSSVGRLFIQVHVTAGYGEPGFDGQYTLEVTSTFPVRVYAGMRICQMRFHSIKGTIREYSKRGHYTGDNARGAVVSHAYETAFD